MEENRAIHYFVDANSSAGYVDLYGQSFGGLGRVAELSDYPDEIAERLLVSVRTRAAEEGLRTEIIHHCLTNRPMGVILPERGAGVINRQTWRPGALSALAALEDETLAEARDALRAAWRLFGEARLVHDEWEKYYIENLSFSAVDALAQETCEKLLGGRRSARGGEGTIVERFFGAATAFGSVDHIPSVTAELRKRYFVKGRPGTGKSTLLKRVAAAAKERGFAVELYRCSLDPNSADMVVVRELGFCVFDSTAPHEYFPDREGDETIDVYRAAVREGTDERYSAELADVQERYRGIIRRATASLAGAQRALEEFQRAKLPAFSAGTLAGQQERLLEALFQN